MQLRRYTIAFLAAVLALAVPSGSFAAADVDRPVIEHLFAFSSMGAYPIGALVGDGTGSYFGVSAGLSFDCIVNAVCGEVVKFSPAGTRYSESVIYRFAPQVFGGNPTSALPAGTLAIDRNGVLYGTLAQGGLSFGSVYTLTPHGSRYAYREIYAFKRGERTPNGGLILDSSGALYGTTATTAYKLVAGFYGYVETTIHVFGRSAGDGSGPGPLLAGPGGALYGTTSSGGLASCTYGGALGCGTIFSLTPRGSRYKETVLFQFPGGPAGVAPTPVLAANSAGALYGLTSAGGDAGCNCGVAFELKPTPAGPVYTVLHAFGGIADPSDAMSPYGTGLTADGAGNFYGVTSLGGSENHGAIFRISKRGVERVVHNFIPPMYPLNVPSPNGLVLDPSGTFLFTTRFGGVKCTAEALSGCGTMLQFLPAF
jgi:uncharacterized repeat protein (TIGR03803 family)